MNTEPISSSCINFQGTPFKKHVSNLALRSGKAQTIFLSIIISNASYEMVVLSKKLYIVFMNCTFWDEGENSITNSSAKYGVRRVRA